MKRIGIDLDNTLVGYDHVFSQVAEMLGIYRSAQSLSKLEIRTALRNEGREVDWMRLQGKVYGQYMGMAKPYQGVEAFLLRCRTSRIPVVIVSQRSLFGHFDDDRVNLREAAMRWLEAFGLFADDEWGVGRRDVYFEATQDDKVARIASLQLTDFIDDLPQVLDHPKFPDYVSRILFSPDVLTPTPASYKSFASWQDISREILGNG